MQILSFDTSSSDIHLSLLKDDKIAFEQIIPPERKNRQESASLLLPAIDSALKMTGWHKADLDLIVVGVGPGSFTGVRVSVITARTIGQALSLPVLPISILEVLAMRSSERPCAIVLDAGGGKLYGAAYSDDLCEISEGKLLEPFCSSPDELVSKLADQAKWIIEPGLDEAVLAKDKIVLQYPSLGNRASAAGLLALKRLRAGSLDLKRKSLSKVYPWDNVLPLYLRSPSVTLKADGSSNKTTSAR